MVQGDTNAVICNMDAATISGAFKTMAAGFTVSGSYAMAPTGYNGNQVVIIGIQNIA